VQDDVGVSAHVGDIPLDLDPERGIEADNFAQVLAYLGGVDVDAADQFEAVALGCKPGRGAADRSEPKLNNTYLVFDFLLPSIPAVSVGDAILMNAWPAGQLGFAWPPITSDIE
jgi:hypothetical protein